MSDVMCVPLHLLGVRVMGVGVDSVDRLEVRVESTREWSRCPYCGFRCVKVWDRRAKRVRDMEVSGRRTTSHIPLSADARHCPRPLSRRPQVSPKDSPSCGGRCNAAPSISVPQRSSRTCSEPASPSLRRADHLTKAHQKHLNQLFNAHPCLRTAWDALQELYGLHEANDLDQANQALGQFA